MLSKKSRFKLMSLAVAFSMFNGMYMPINYVVATAETDNTKAAVSSENVTTGSAVSTGEGYEQSFENGIDDWSVRGHEVVEQNSTYAKKGSSSLKISGRTKTWEGPIKDFTNILTKGKTYHFSIYIMYNDAAGAGNQQFDLKIQNTYADGTAKYESIASVKASKGNWTEIQGDYTISPDANVTNYAVYLELPYKSNASITDAEKISFYIDNVSVKELQKDYQKDIPQLKNVFKDYFPIGTCATATEVDSNDIHSEFIKYHYNAMVAGNAMKADALQPTEGNFKWDDADKIVKYAQDNDMVLRGHTLVWHNQTPAWFFQDPTDSTKKASRDVLLQRMKTHIEAVVGRYKGKIKYWDVCNEIMSDSNGLRASDWKNIIGDVDGDGYDSDYIELAFKYAHEADPDAKLIINDYNTEWNGTKRDNLYNLIKRMLQKGIPIDGVGLQMHINMNFPEISTIKTSLEKFASLKSIDPDFIVQVTELDMSIYGNSGEGQKTVNDYISDAQATKYKALFDMFKTEAASGNLNLVMMWGNSDDDTWLDNFPVAGRKDSPLFFDRYLQAKAAYYSVVGLPKPAKPTTPTNPTEPTNPTNPTTPTVTKQTVNAVNAAPVIGDVVDSKWQMAIPFDVKTYVTGTSGSTAKVKSMWDASNLYIYADVTDSTVSNSDGVDIYVDNGNSGYNKYTVNRSTNTDTIKVIQTSTGYKVQAKLPLTATQAIAGSKLTFDMKIKDYNSNGNLTSSVVWIDRASTDALAFTNGGTLAFGKEPKLVEAKKGTPVIDGNIDGIWSTANSISTDVSLKDANTAKANVKLLWDEHYVYALYQVTDSVLDKTAGNKYDQDSVEGFIDENDAKTSSYDSDDAQYRVNYVNEQSGNGNSAVKNPLFKSAAATTDTGYIVEMAIPLNNVGSLGQIIGFDAQVNDAVAGTRKGINIWCGDSDNTWSTMANAGNVLFVNAGVLKGDVNDDGKVDILDYALLQRYIKNSASLTINVDKADISGDSKVTVADLLALRKMLLNY